VLWLYCCSVRDANRKPIIQPCRKSERTTFIARDGQPFANAGRPWGTSKYPVLHGSSYKKRASRDRPTVKIALIPNRVETLTNLTNSRKAGSASFVQAARLVFPDQEGID
jgi:hypothetical protein